jgi:hypothetical protein
LNCNEKIKKIAEKEGHVFTLKEEAKNSKALQQIYKTCNQKYVEAEKVYILIRYKEKTAGDDKNPDN